MALIVPVFAADITVIVTDGKSPIPDTAVSVRETGREEYTDDKGKAVISGLTNGTYTIAAFLSGYSRETRTVLLRNTNVTLAMNLSNESIRYAKDVVVTAKRTEGTATGQTTIKKEAMMRTTQVAFNDAVSSLQSLPGVSSSGGTFDSRMFIQGGDQTEWFSMMDGVYIPVPQRFGGRISMFNPLVIDRIDLYTAGYPASFGQGLSGILDVKTLNGSRTAWSGFIDAGLATGEIKLDGPITSNITVFFDIRRTYYDFVAPLFIRDEWRDSVQFPYLVDGLLKCSWYVSENDLITLSGYGSLEGMDWDMAITISGFVSSSLPPGASGNDHYRALHGLLECRYEHRFGNDYFELFGAVMPRSTASWRTSDGLSSTSSNVENEMFYQSGMNWYVNSLESHKLSFGAVYFPLIANAWYRTDYYKTNGTSTVYSNYSNYSRGYPDIIAHYTAAYIMDDWTVVPSLILQAGLRGEYNFFTPEYQLNPRGGVKWEMTKEMGLYIRGGLYSMFPLNWNYINTNTGNPDLFSQKAVHGIVGYEYGSTLYTAKAECFVKRYYDVFERDQSNRYMNTGTRNVYGGDIYLQKKEEEHGWFNGWLSYTYVHGTESINGLAVPLQPSNTLFTPAYLREHTVSAILEFTYRSNTVTPVLNWLDDVKLSFDFRLTGGKPYTPGIGVATNIASGYTNYQVTYAAYNSARTPVVHNLDIKLTLPVSLFTLIGLFGVETKSTTAITFVNVYNQRNELDYSFRVSADKTLERRYVLDFPFFAVLDMKIEF